MTRRTRSTSSLDRRLSTLENDARPEHPTASIACLLGASAVGGPTGPHGENDIEPVDPDAGHYRMFGEVFYVPDWIPAGRGALGLDDEGRVLFADGDRSPAEVDP